jgi:hypothetical protein
MPTDTVISPRDLRIAIARFWHPRYLYELAAHCHVHPVTFSAVLNGRIPLDQEFARRVLTVLQDDYRRVAACQREGSDGR